MSNSFNIDVKPEISANLVQILSNASALSTIQIIDLPAIDSLIDILDTNIDAIIDNHIPGTNAKVELNLAAIDTIDGIVDAIKLKTDATPQNVRGKWYIASLLTSESELQEVINITGHGKLYTLSMLVLNSADTVEVKVTVDGTAWSVISHTGDTVSQSLIPDSMMAAAGIMIKFPDPQTSVRLFDLEFSTSLLVEVRRSAGTTSNVRCRVSYLLDAFDV